MITLDFLSVRRGVGVSGAIQYSMPSITEPYGFTNLGRRINLPLSAVTLTVVYMFLSATTPLPGKGITERILSLDLVGCGIFTPTVFMFLLAMNRGGKEDPWNSATIIGLFVGAGVMAALFVAWEARKGNAAMIPGNIVRRRTILCTILFAACHMGALVIASYYLPYWFQGVKDTDPIDSGVRILPTVLAQLISTGIGSGLGEWRAHVVQKQKDEQSAKRPRSPEVSILQSLVLLGRYFYVRRQRTLHSIPSRHPLKRVDRLSGLARHRCWVWNANAISGGAA